MSERSTMMKAQIDVCKRRHRMRHVFIPTFIQLVLIVVGFVLVPLRAGETAMVTWTFGVLIGSIALWYWIHYWQVRRTIGRYKDRCVYCDYDMRAAIWDEHGTCVCPECGHQVMPLAARFSFRRTMRVFDPMQ